MSASIDAQPSREPVVAPELSSILPAAEDLARLRAEVEGKIVDDKLPPSDWLGFTHEALIKYPKIEAYGKVIDSAVDWAIHHRNKLDDFWRQFNLPDEQTQANSEHSRLMCSELYKLYGFGPKGEVKINKGAFTLNITLGDEDYNNLAEKVGVVMRGSTAFSRSDDGMRIGIFNAKSKVPDANEAHETEHSKNKSLEYSYKWLPLESLPIGDVSKGVARLQEGRYARAQDEIIAMFAGAEAIFPGRREAVEHFRESFPRIMIKNYPVEDEGVTGEEYTENVNSGFKAIFDLLEMYEGVNYDINPARMAINVLAQFPLDKWPAVVRLIKQRKANTSRIRRPMTSEKLGE
jgi:hypothetical protein